MASSPPLVERDGAATALEEPACATPAASTIAAASGRDFGEGADMVASLGRAGAEPALRSNQVAWTIIWSAAPSFPSGPRNAARHRHSAAHTGCRESSS